MKPVTCQDTKWTRFQTTQGPKHQHVKLRVLRCLPIRSTQPERYSRSPGRHDLLVQIRRLKRPLVAKVWLPTLWASMIPSIWTCGRPNSGQQARRYGPRNASCTDMCLLLYIRLLIARHHATVQDPKAIKLSTYDMGAYFSRNLHFIFKFKLVHESLCDKKELMPLHNIKQEG
jgi:hypothetical protein